MNPGYALPDDVLLLVDECRAYAELLPSLSFMRRFSILSNWETRVIMCCCWRTFSKIYGLAGLRVGWGYFADDIRDQVRKVLNPGSVSLLSQVAARAAMEDQEAVREARPLNCTAARVSINSNQRPGFDSSTQSNQLYPGRFRYRGRRGIGIRVFAQAQAGGKTDGRLRFTLLPAYYHAAPESRCKSRRRRWLSGARLVRNRSFELGDITLADTRLRRIGMIVPGSNTNAEPDCLLLVPPGVTIHTTRSGGYDVEAIPDSDEMRRFARQSLDEQLQLLVDGRVELIAYACTSATLADGPEFDQAFCDEITAKTGLPAVTRRAP